MNKPNTTLFMLSSVDGKISTGNTNNRDTDKDFHRIKGVLEGLQQYYDLEKQTDLHSLNTGKVMAKIGINSSKSTFPDLSFMSFIILDNNHLEKTGIENLANNLKKLYLVTSNKDHPAYCCKNSNIEIIFYENEVNFEDLFVKFKQKYKINDITIQSGGTLNSVFLRKKLIDNISIVIAPVLVGGKDTPTLIDGETLLSEDDLKYVKALKLIYFKKLNNSYLHLKYEVINETEIINKPNN